MAIDIGLQPILGYLQGAQVRLLYTKSIATGCLARAPIIENGEQGLNFIMMRSLSSDFPSFSQCTDTILWYSPCWYYHFCLIKPRWQQFDIDDGEQVAKYK